MAWHGAYLSVFKIRKARTRKQKRLTILAISTTNTKQRWINRDVEDTISSQKYQGIDAISVDKQDTNKRTAQKHAAMSVEQWANTPRSSAQRQCATGARGKDISVPTVPNHEDPLAAQNVTLTTTLQRTAQPSGASTNTCLKSQQTVQWLRTATTVPMLATLEM